MLPTTAQIDPTRAKSPPVTARSPRTPRISVVVPTDRRPKALQRCLQALLRQQFPPLQYEIIVVDDAHSDRTRRQVEAMAHEAGPSACLRYLRPETGRGPSVARNCGWQAARAPLIAFVADDTIPLPDWLMEGERALHLSKDAAIACRVVVPPASRQPARQADDRTGSSTGKSTVLVTANAFMRRDALHRVGGFDERFTRASHEDVDLQYRLEQRFGSVRHCGTAVVLRPSRPQPWGESLRQQRRVFFDALLYREHPQRYGQALRGVRPWNDYTIVALYLSVLAFLWAGAWPLALVSVSIGVALVLQLAARRMHEGDARSPRVVETLATSALIPFLTVYWRLRGALHFRVWFW